MTCPSTEQLAALYDGVLPTRQAIRIRAHLCQCSRCARELKVMDTLMRIGPVEQKPSDPTLHQAMQLTTDSSESIIKTNHNSLKKRKKARL